MSTRILRELSNVGNHEVGNLCSLKVKTVAYGAKCLEDIDNFLLVELGFNSDGERTCQALTDVTNQGYLIASPELRMLGNVAQEELVDFFNGEDESARIVILESLYTRFDTSAFTLNTGVTEIANGQFAHFDPTTKKFIISATGHIHADYATAVNKFTVVHNEGDTEYSLCGKEIVRLEAK